MLLLKFSKAQKIKKSDSEKITKSDSDFTTYLWKLYIDHAKLFPAHTPLATIAKDREIFFQLLHKLQGLR